MATDLLMPTEIVIENPQKSRHDDATINDYRYLFVPYEDNFWLYFEYIY